MPEFRDEVAPVIRMELSRIIISETNDEQVSRAFPIVIGIWEAVAIDRNIKGKKTPRPMTHDLIENVIQGLDSRLEKVVVTDLKDRTFFARLYLKRNGKTVEIDSRPSDAIALAVQMKAPIYVNESVLQDVLPAGDGGGLPGPGEGEPGEEGFPPPPTA
jgi:bifunctional DNase/RNase